MPLTKISAPKHLEFAKVKSLADAVQEGLVRTCNVPPRDLFQLITRFESEEMVLDPTFGGVDRSGDACIAESRSFEDEPTNRNKVCSSTSLSGQLPLAFARTTS